MLIKVDHDHWYDWELRHVGDIPEGIKPEAVRPTHRENYRQVRVVYQFPNTTDIVVPDESWDTMFKNHVEGVRLAAKGYQTVHIGDGGGFVHGAEREVAPRSLPLKSRNQVLAEHLQLVMTNHSHPSKVTAVRVVVPHVLMKGDDAQRLERYLTVVLSGGAAA